jgi:hypothetical protein
MATVVRKYCEASPVSPPGYVPRTVRGTDSVIAPPTSMLFVTLMIITSHDEKGGLSAISRTEPDGRIKARRRVIKRPRAELTAAGAPCRSDPGVLRSAGRTVRHARDVARPLLPGESLARVGADVGLGRRRGVPQVHGAVVAGGGQGRPDGANTTV